MPLACSTESKGALSVGAVLIALLVAGCSDVPSKSDALSIVQQEIKEDASCTLPISLLSRLKMQYSSKAVCVTREGGPPMDAAMVCLDALVAGGVTKRMPGGYMAEWPDEVSGAAFNDVSPYERRARDLMFKGCVEMVGDLRDGRFRCGQARADKIVRITKKEDGRAIVRYSRVVTLDPQLETIEKVCGTVSRPAPEATATFEKGDPKAGDKRWVLAPLEGTTSPTPSSPSEPSSPSSP